jgi:predicted DNA-binding transcriptional regulator AlpA
MARNRTMGLRQVLNQDIDNLKSRMARDRWCVSHDQFQGCRRAHTHAAKTVDTVIAELRRRPIVQPEWLSLQETAIYCGYSEQQFSDFVKRSIAPKSVLFSRNARRFKRTDVDAWCAAGGPSAYASKGEHAGVHK